jgi:hypothetical protein
MICSTLFKGFKGRITMVEGLSSIITQLERQKTAIDRALAVLREIDGTEATRAAEDNSAPATRKGGMTPEGKKRLVKALKKRWAAKKAAVSPDEVPAKGAPRKANFTPEGRQRLAEAMKRRWAVKRSAAQAKKRAGRPKKSA